ncbi:MAG: response regulator [Calditrichaeota bacterium]|nr:MAG: response regulator [Calditrichota bacterium]
MSSRKSIRILLAEDDEGHAILIKDALSENGLLNQIDHVHDGQEALDYLYGRNGFEDKGLAAKPDIILLDINMPRVDGLEVLERIKKDDNLKNIPVIMLTTTNNQREIDRSYKLGANSYITKPVEFDDFIEKITKLGMFLEIVALPTVE